MTDDVQASILGAFNNVVPSLALISLAAYYFSLIHGLVVAASHPPSQRQPRDLLLAFYLPIWTLVFLALCMAHLHDIGPGPVSRPGLIQFAGIKFLIDSALMTLALCSCLCSVGPDDRATRTWLRDSMAKTATRRAVRLGLLIGLGTGLWSFLVIFTHDMTPHPSLDKYTKTLAEYPTFLQAMFMVPSVFGHILLEEGVWRVLAPQAVWMLTDTKKPSHGAWWAVIIGTSILWTLSHSYSLSNVWAKYIQIFPLGLAYGWLGWRYGLPACFIAHLIHNAMPFVFIGFGGEFPELPK